MLGGVKIVSGDGVGGEGIGLGTVFGQLLQGVAVFGVELLMLQIVGDAGGSCLLYTSIIDSTADMTPEIKSRVYTVPLTVHFGREEYIDGVTIDHKTFYEKLIESDVLPTTSQATPSAFAQEYERARQAGEAAVVITLASKFSGTYQSAVIAAADYENVYVVDGASAAMGTGILVELALRLLDGGMSAKEIAETLETEKKKIVVVALVDTLEYLKRGGRISKTARCV